MQNANETSFRYGKTTSRNDQDSKRNLIDLEIYSHKKNARQNYLAFFIKYFKDKIEVKFS